MLDWAPVTTEASEAESTERASHGCLVGMGPLACTITSHGVWSLLWDEGKGHCTENGSNQCFLSTCLGAMNHPNGNPS